MVQTYDYLYSVDNKAVDTSQVLALVQFTLHILVSVRHIEFNFTDTK